MCHGAAQVTWLSFTDYRVITGIGHPKTAEKPQFLGALLTSGRTGKRCISPVFVGQGPCIDGNDATYHRFFVG